MNLLRWGRTASSASFIMLRLHLSMGHQTQALTEAMHAADNVQPQEPGAALSYTAPAKPILVYYLSRELSRRDANVRSQRV
jgi:hypothetical protein